MTDRTPTQPGSTAQPREIATVGIIGAGTMGGGIAMNFANAGLPVTLVEAAPEALDRGLAVVRRNYENSARKGRITPEQVEERMALIRPSLSYDDLADVDLVIEAVFENMAVKQEIFARLDRVCKPGAILATNTSTLDIDTIAAATARPPWARLPLHQRFVDERPLRAHPAHRRGQSPRRDCGAEDGASDQRMALCPHPRRCRGRRAPPLSREAEHRLRSRWPRGCGRRLGR